mgnify:CR=1 FL=1
MGQPINDLVIEGAISLMNKVGQDYESRTLGKEAKKKEFDYIIEKFRECENLADGALISNRIKSLIKNMFINKESGWLYTKIAELE